MRRSKLILGTALAVIAVASGSEPAGADPGYAPGELVVRFRGGAERLVELPQGVGVPTAAGALDSNRRIAYAVPNYIARAAASAPSASSAGYIPNDRGTTNSGGGWQATQWNFLPCGSLCDAAGTTPLAYQSRGGIDAPRAWETLRGLGRAGAAGVRVAVLDTGVAYRTQKPKFSKSPDFSTRQFVRGFDFVGDDRLPFDEDGHGTHIAGTIGEQTDNGKSLTGLAYGAELMPVRVLDELGEGKAREIGKGLVYAVKHGARVINMSFEFGGAVNSCKDVRSVCRGIRYASRHGVTVVAAAGNDFNSVASFPARAPGVIGVGASTEGGCLAGYSNHGLDVDLVAPGGQGEGATLCQSPDRPIFQLTIAGSDLHVFGLPAIYAGTSMAAAHVSGVAAMIIASGELGARPSPARILCQLGGSARRTGLGEPFDASRWGAGLLDAGNAVAGAAC
ncbi:MAG: S8 family serine peptidase [Solirubrobacterales bacterium]